MKKLIFMVCISNCDIEIFHDVVCRQIYNDIKSKPLLNKLVCSLMSHLPFNNSSKFSGTSDEITRKFKKEKQNEHLLESLQCR